MEEWEKVLLLHYAAAHNNQLRRQDHHDTGDAQGKIVRFQRPGFMARRQRFTRLAPACFERGTVRQSLPAVAMEWAGA